jgi:hypothetical protein
MTTHFLAPIAIRLPLIVLTAAVAVWAGTTGIAGLYNFQADSYLELWNQKAAKNSNYQIDDSDYQTALDASQHAVELVPYNSDYHLLSADIQMWRYLSHKDLSIPERQQMKTNILNHYHIALKQRPSWSYTYANFALTKARLGEVDDEMQNALQRANQLGANEVDVLHITLELGLFLWGQLDNTTRLTIANAAERSLTWKLNEKLNTQERVYTLNLVDYYQRRADICSLLAAQGSPITSDLCLGLK